MKGSSNARHHHYPPQQSTSSSRDVPRCPTVPRSTGTKLPTKDWTLETSTQGEKTPHGSIYPQDFTIEQELNHSLHLAGQLWVLQVEIAPSDRHAAIKKGTAVEILRKSKEVGYVVFRKAIGDEMIKGDALLLFGIPPSPEIVEPASPPSPCNVKI